MTVVIDMDSDTAAFIVQFKLLTLYLNFPINYGIIYLI